MTSDEIIVETARLGHSSTRDAIRWAIQQERQNCAMVCEEVMQRYESDTALNPDQSKVGAMSAELCALWIRKRGEE
jgi:hypothetical protein